ncbi:MAG TPA: hypothetical protein VGV59_02985 [Pyrinomonadaceae bacterium]|nr:hypothetical protein [Pyrinomonadaceae bacterium]
MNNIRNSKFGILGGLVASLCLVFALSSSASAQRIPVERIGGRMVDIKVGEITLESIDFRRQTATLNLGLDVTNRLIPVSLKDFDYSLRLNNQETIDGRYEGTLNLGGRRGASRVDLPVVVNLRSIPGVVWSAFSNRGRVRYELDTGFTLPLFITEKRFDQSFSGEVPLRTVVDAASILRARRIADGGSGGGRDERGVLGTISDIWGF